MENLLINAAEAIQGEGTVRIGERSLNGAAGICLADSGIGMSQEFMVKKLFRPFQSTKPKGLGIGLYQCREMLRKIGGDIVAESTPGQGSKFTLVFPK